MCFGGVMRVYRGVRRCQIHMLFVGNLMVSLRLNGGDCHETHGWREQLDADALSLLSAESNVY